MNIELQFNELVAKIEEVGLLARRYFEEDNTDSEQKDDGSVVTAVDMAIERVLREFIETNFPDDVIVGEEEEDKAGSSEFVWHIDPIDGTDNFLRKIPFCGISVARLGNTPEDSFGIIHNPLTGQTFSSLMENGVYENRRVRKMDPEPLGGKYMFSIGRGREEWMKAASYKILEAVGMKYGRAKEYGSLALELAYLAAGRIDAVVTFGLHSYDYAAGLYLCKTAGGMISVFDGEWQVWERSLKELCAEPSRTIFVSHPDIHEKMRDFVGNPKRWS